MRNEKGVFLVSSFLVLSMIGTFSLALFLKNIALYRASERVVNRITAFHLAESGLDQALTQLRTNSNYSGQGYTNLGNRGGYDIQVEIPDPVGSPTLRRVTSVGHTPSNASTAYAYARRQVLAYVDLSSPSPFNFSLFANDKLKVEGNAMTDSYDSRNSPYDPSKAGSNGDIGTNGISSGIIKVEGNARVKGDAVVGPGADVSKAIKIDGHGSIDGTKSAATAPVTLDPVQIPSNLTEQGSLKVTGDDTVTLAGGTYWFSKIKIDGKGKVNFTGPATIYVTGKAEIAGKGIGTAQDLPPNLVIKVQGKKEEHEHEEEEEGDAKVKISGNASFFGAIYAPTCKSEISGNGVLYGAIVGDTVKESGDGKVHYDEALKQTTAGTTGQGSRVLAWTEG